MKSVESQRNGTSYLVETESGDDVLFFVDYLDRVIFGWVVGILFVAVILHMKHQIQSIYIELRKVM